MAENAQNKPTPLIRHLLDLCVVLLGVTVPFCLWGHMRDGTEDIAFIAGGFVLSDGPAMGLTLAIVFYYAWLGKRNWTVGQLLSPAAG